MPIGKTVFSLLMDMVPEYDFKKCVDKYNGDFHALKFTCRDHFRVMSYAQFTDRASLRDIEATLTVFSAHYALTELGFENIVVYAADIPTTGIEKAMKTDAVDSEKIAWALKRDELTGIYIKDQQHRRDRFLIPDESRGLP